MSWFVRHVVIPIMSILDERAAKQTALNRLNDGSIPRAISFPALLAIDAGARVAVMEGPCDNGGTVHINVDRCPSAAWDELRFAGYQQQDPQSPNWHYCNGSSRAN